MINQPGWVDHTVETLFCGAREECSGYIFDGDSGRTDCRCNRNNRIKPSSLQQSVRRSQTVRCGKKTTCVASKVQDGQFD